MQMKLLMVTKAMLVAWCVHFWSTARNLSLVSFCLYAFTYHGAVKLLGQIDFFCVGKLAYTFFLSIFEGSFLRVTVHQNISRGLMMNGLCDVGILQQQIPSVGGWVN